MVLYSAVSSPLDRSKRFTLSSPGRPVHSDTVLGFSWKHSSHAAIAQRLFTHISTTVYSQVLIYTAESTEASWSERKCPNFETVTTGIRSRALSIASPAFYQLSYRAPHVGCSSSEVGALLRNLGKFVYTTLCVSFGPHTGCVVWLHIRWIPHSSLEKDNSLNHSCVFSMYFGPVLRNSPQSWLPTQNDSPTETHDITQICLALSHVNLPIGKIAYLERKLDVMAPGYIEQWQAV